MRALWDEKSVLQLYLCSVQLETVKAVCFQFLTLQPLKLPRFFLSKQVCTDTLYLFVCFECWSIESMEKKTARFTSKLRNWLSWWISATLSVGFLFRPEPNWATSSARSRNNPQLQSDEHALDDDSTGGNLCSRMIKLEDDPAAWWSCWRMTMLEVSYDGCWLCWMLIMLDDTHAGGWSC